MSTAADLVRSRVKAVCDSKVAGRYQDLLSGCFDAANKGRTSARFFVFDGDSIPALVERLASEGFQVTLHDGTRDTMWQTSIEISWDKK